MISYITASWQSVLFFSMIAIIILFSIGLAIGAIISASRPSPRFSRFESDPASPFNGSAISENVFEFRDIMPNSLNAQAGRSPYFRPGSSISGDPFIH